jgi:hypothetical protein
MTLSLLGAGRAAPGGGIAALVVAAGAGSYAIGGTDATLTHAQLNGSPIGLLLALTREGGGLWTPSELGGDVVAWYAADDAANFDLTGSDVDQWDDLSGGGFHLTDETAKPVLETVADFGGLTAVKFDGTSRLRNDPISFVQPLTIVSMIRTSSSIQDVENYINGGGTIALSYKWSGASNNPHAFCGSAVARHGANLSNSTPYLDVTHLDGASSYTRINGNTATTYDPGTGQLSDITIGGTGLGGWTGSACHFAELIFVDRALTSGEYEKCEGYLAHKWSREGDLPGGHPYKAAPPPV